MNITTKSYPCVDQTIHAYTFENDFLKVTALDFGATIHEILKKENDEWVNMVASFDTIEQYITQPGPYLNAIVGPVAGRIAYGKYDLDGIPQQLSINNGKNHLHGGTSGVSKKYWTITPLENAIGVKACLKTTHDEDGFKGTFDYTITYTLQDNNLIIDYLCIPEYKTLLNMTSHLYFNLSKDLSSNVLDHSLQFSCDEKLKLHEDGHPYAIEKIEENGPFDFNSEKTLQENFDKGSDEFKISVAFDTPFLLKDGIVTLSHKPTNRKVTIHTDQKAMVVYTANWFDENQVFTNGIKGYPYCSVAIETQDAPNGINIENYDQHQIFDHEHPYTQKTIFTFE